MRGLKPRAFATLSETSPPDIDRRDAGGPPFPPSPVATPEETEVLSAPGC